MRQPAVVDRDREVQVLRDLVRRARQGEGGTCLVTGQAGIGKSALVAEALDTEATAGATVLRARAAELEGGLAFGVVRDLLGAHVHRLPSAEQDELFVGPAGLARAVLGLSTDTGGDPFYGLFWLVSGLAERQPLVLCVDDLHWSDQESARFLTYLARRLEGLCVALVVTARAAEPGADAASAVELQELAEVLELGPLGAEALALLVPGRPSDEVLRLTGGNPLLAVELARALAEGADPDEVSSRKVGTSILRRVSRLSPEAQALARAVALCSAPLTVGDAAALTELDEPTAVHAADALVRADVLAWDGERLTYLHPLMRTAVYDQLDPVARRAGHTRAARVLGDRGADVESVAGHLLQAEPGDEPRHLEVLLAAADEAERRLAPRAAVRYLARATKELPDDARVRVDVLHRLGRLQLHVGEPAVEALEAARQADPTSLVLASDLADAHLADGRWADAVELLSPHLPDVARTDEDLDIAFLVLAGLLEGPPDPERAAAVAGRIPVDLPGDTPAQRSALCGLAYFSLISGASGEHLRSIARRIGGDLGARPRAFVSMLRGLVLGAAGLFDERERLAEEQAERARRHGLEAVYLEAEQERAIINNQRGRLREAEASLRLVVESPASSPSLRLNGQDWLVTTLSMQGRWDEAEELLLQLSREEGLPEVMVARRRGEIAMDRRDFALAVEIVEAFHEAVDARIPAFSGSGCDLAVALASIGRVDDAARLAGDLLRLARETDAVQTIGLATWAMGCALPGEEGLSLLEESVAVLSASPYRWNQANSELSLGAALRRAGRRAHAREVLESALEYAVANGAAPIEQAARDELRLCGARPRRAARTGVAALTPSEERIARLAAEGRTNKEIAQHLFVTVKNVEMHLVHAYRKLEVASRRDLVAAFER